MILKLKGGGTARAINGRMYTSRSNASNGSKPHRYPVSCQASRYSGLSSDGIVRKILREWGFCSLFGIGLENKQICEAGYVRLFRKKS